MDEVLRPRARFLSDQLIDRIVQEASSVLAALGVEVACSASKALLLEAGATTSSAGRVQIPVDLVERSLATAPSAFTLFDRDGEPHAELGGGELHFTPGSSAIRVLDRESWEPRSPNTVDYVRFTTLSERLSAIDYQSTAFVPRDVPESIADSYRLYLSLVYGRSPVVTGAFTVAGYRVMVELMEAARGDRRPLAEAPLAVFSACPTAPLRWSDVTARNVYDCAKAGIPVEFIAMPLTGFVAPGTLVGTLVQHTAETLSGLVISQLAAPGAPVLWGGSPTIFDYRYETTPMGAIETQMLACGYVEIGKHLQLPTQAYIGMSDAKALDAQAGLETASGSMLAALVGVDSVSGPGMLDFENCQSLEKLVVDNEVCAMAKRLAAGISPREGDFPSQGHFEELLRDGHTLIADHTRRWFRKEVTFPSPVIARANLARFQAEGSEDLLSRAKAQVDKILAEPPEPIDSDRRRELDAVMLRAARAAGMEELPDHGC